MLFDVQTEPHFGLWGLFVSSFVSATLAPGGSEALLAYLLGLHDEPVWLLWLVATTGNTLGGSSNFALGFLIAKGWASPDNLLANKNQKAFELLHRWGAPVLVLSWLPVVGDVLCVMAGWLRLSLIVSVLAMFTGKGLRYAGVIYLHAWVES